MFGMKKSGCLLPFPPIPYRKLKKESISNPYSPGPPRPASLCTPPFCRGSSGRSAPPLSPSSTSTSVGASVLEVKNSEMKKDQLPVFCLGTQHIETYCCPNILMRSPCPSTAWQEGQVLLLRSQPRIQAEQYRWPHLVTWGSEAWPRHTQQDMLLSSHALRNLSISVLHFLFNEGSWNFTAKEWTSRKTLVLIVIVVSTRSIGQ